MKSSWSKRLYIASDILLAIYLVFVFTSFDRKNESKTMCSKVNIEIADDATSGFIDTKVIKNRLQKAGVYPIGKRLNTVNARAIEDMLRTSPFVKTAECYKTEGGTVYISVTQRMPVIRIKADNGDDYYVDDNDCIMPRSNYTSDLIIATGSISRRYATTYLSPLGKTIMQNDLWKNLVEQINILPDQNVEIVPRIGNHIVLLGKLPENIDRKKREKAIAEFFNHKMTRLEKFYRYGLSEVGWNKYSYINIEFDNQIICRKGKAEQARHIAEPTSVKTDGQNATTATPNSPSEATTATDGASTTESNNATSADNKAKNDAKKNDLSVNKTAKTEKAGKKTDNSTEKKKTGKQASKVKVAPQTTKTKAKNKPTVSKTGKATENKKKKSSN